MLEITRQTTLINTAYTDKINLLYLINIYHFFILLISKLHEQYHHRHPIRLAFEYYLLIHSFYFHCPIISKLLPSTWLLLLHLSPLQPLFYLPMPKHFWSDDLQLHLAKALKSRVFLPHTIPK